jgi:hypothetical protein
MGPERVQSMEPEHNCGRGGGARRMGRGPKGTCACSACGHQVPHQPGVPCREVKCPQCGGAMIRKD